METKYNNNDQQKTRRPLSRSEVEQESFLSSHSADSTFTSGSVGEDFIDTVMEEKATIIRSPEKMASTFFETRQLRGEDTQTAPSEPSNGRSRPRVSFSFPGAFPVGDARQQDDSQQQASVSIESVSSEDSEESEVFVIPRVSLAEDDKDVEAQKRTSSVHDIPMVIAEERVVVDASAATQPSRKGTSRLFRLTVVACLLLIAGIITGLLIPLLERRGGPEEGFPNNNGGNSGGRDGNDSGGGNEGGGGGGGGNGGGGGQRLLRPIIEFDAIDRDFGFGNNIGN
jgi:uncharacterized membrane protein YgcG